MTSKPFRAALALAMSLAAQAARAEDCPAKSSGFDDVAVSLTKAPNCLRAMQVFEACRYDSSELRSDPALCQAASGRVKDACEFAADRVAQLEAIVKKKCDAETAKSPQREECPAKSTQMNDIIAALDETPGCDRAMKVFEACEYGASGDVQFGAVVEEKCEADFLTRLRAPMKAAYARDMRGCDRKYRNQSGTMYISFTAFCRARVAQRYSRQMRK